MYPSLVEVDRSGIGFVSLKCEVDWLLYRLRAYPSVVRRCWREEFGTPFVVTNPPRWRFPRWEIVDRKSFTVVKAGM